MLTNLIRNPFETGYADAARLRAAGRPPPSRWQRTSSSIVRLAVLAGTGLLFAVAYQHAVAAQPEADRARAQLLADVRARQERTDELQRQADQLRHDVDGLRDEALAGTGADAGRLRELAAHTGLAKVRGDGVIVRVADAPTPVDPVTGEPAGNRPGQVVDRDLQDIANALWRAGAEAIAVNGQRLTGTSTIRAAGAAILVDFRPVTSPYELAAIGPDDIAATFDGSPTARRFRGYSAAYRMQFTVRKLEDLTLPAATDPRLRYARNPSTAASPNPSGSQPAAPPGGGASAGVPKTPSGRPSRGGAAPATPPAGATPPSFTGGIG